MLTIEPTLRLRMAERLEREPQRALMDAIPQFAQAEICTLCPPPAPDGMLRTLVFNMERGVNLQETIDFLRFCPKIQPFDLILANELDDGCNRSGGRDTAREIAEALGLNYVFGLEFIELTDPTHPKGYHGNAVFSRYPIVWAETLRLPESYNWYFDRQRRIGGRNAVLAKLDVGGKPVGVASIHLENRTDGAGRLAQMQAVLDECMRVFPGMPVILGGDLNTNTFDGRDKQEIGKLAECPALQQEQMARVDEFEPLLPLCERAGYAWRRASGGGEPTRRKPLPDGSTLPMRLDWILPRGLITMDSRVVSTKTEDCGFAPADSALAAFTGEELSDHNAVWAALKLR